MEKSMGSRFKHAWNVFFNGEQDPTPRIRDLGASYSYRPDRFRFTSGFAFKQDLFLSLLDEGNVAAVPIDTDTDLNTGSCDTTLDIYTHIDNASKKETSVTLGNLLVI
ncbi:MAG: hypothetical protein II881_08630 [Oscillospiraceae bacterium]|nr:hypothetical protein [Oscillospiraceae bacterium]